MNKKYLLASIVAFAVLYFGSIGAGLLPESFLNFFGGGNSQLAAVVQSVTTGGSSVSYTLNDNVNQIDKLNQSIGLLQERVLAAPAGSRLADFTLQSVSPALESALKSRAILMLKLAKERPELFLKLTLIKKYRVLIPPALIKYIEQETSIKRGVMEVLHIDDFANPENSRFEYSIRQGNTRLAFYPVGTLNMRSGAKVNLTGFKLGNALVANIANNLEVVEPPPPMDSVGNQRTLALITEMQDQISPVSVSEVEQVLFAPDSPFQTYYRDQSYGKVSFSGKAYKILLNRALGDGCASGVQLSDADVINTIQLQSIDLSKYDRVLFIPPVGYCSGVAKWSHIINGNTYLLSESWVGWGAFRYSFDDSRLNGTLAHEIGHALGVMHANFLLCSQNDECSHKEYGNYYDVMGTSGRDGGHFNALYKEQLGWLTSADFLNITNTGKYSMNALESTDGKRAAKVVNPQIGPLSVVYLEKRMKDRQWVSGVQNDGLLLNIPEQPLNKSSAVELIDMNPGFPSWDGDSSSGDWSDVVLRQGKAFDLQLSGMTIGPVQNVSSTSIDFYINLQTPSCRHFLPTISNSYHSSSPTAGDDGYAGFNITNRDYYGCGSSDFDIVPVSPSSWQYRVRPETGLTLAPRSSEQIFLNFTLPAATTPGNYTLSIDIINKTSGLRRRIDFPIIVNPPPVITSISPISGPIGTKITIQGTGFAAANMYVRFHSPSLGGNLFPFLKPQSVSGSFTIPDELRPGLYSVSVRNNNSESNKILFEILDKPEIISFSSPSVPIRGKFKIFGKNLSILNENIVQFSPQPGRVFSYATSSVDGVNLDVSVSGFLPPGIHQVSIKHDGGVSNELPLTLRVSRLPVIQSVTGPTSVLPGDTIYTWTMLATDPDGTSFTYEVDWGNNSKTTGKKKYDVANSIQTIPFTRNFPTAGVFKPLFTLTDADGLIATSSPITITAATSTATTTPPIIATTTPSITVTSPTENQIIIGKVGATIDMRWAVQNWPSDRWVSIELLDRNNKIITKTTNQDPSGSYPISINTNATTTKTYRVNVYGGDLTNSSIGPEAVSGWFNIVPPTPTSTTTVPVLNSVSSPVFQGRNLVIVGSGFSANGNTVRLTSVTASSTVYYARNLPSSNNGANISFTIGTSTPPGRYYLAVQALNSDWSGSGKMAAQTIVEIKAPIGSASSGASGVGDDNSEAQTRASTLLRRLEDIRDRINMIP